MKPIGGVTNGHRNGHKLQSHQQFGNLNGYRSNPAEDDAKDVDFDHHDKFWQTKLAGALPSSYPQTADSHLRMSRQSLISGGACGLEEDKDAAQLTDLICAAWALVLSYHDDAKDIVLGLQLSSGSTTLPLRARVDYERTVASFLDEVGTWTQHIRESILSLEEVRLVSKDAETACMFRTAIEFQELGALSSFQSGLQSQLLPHCALVLECLHRDNELSFSARFDRRAVSRLAVRMLMSELEHTVWQLTRPNTATLKLADLQPLSPLGRQQILQFNRPLQPKVDGFLHHAIDEQCARRPDATAIDAWDGSLTYEQLRVQSDKLAQYLHGVGVGPNVLVPVLHEKSVMAVVALLAVIKAGGAIVPLDPKLPTARIHMIIEDVNASVVISSSAHGDKVPRHVSQHIVLGGDLEQKLAVLPPTDIVHRQPPNSEDTLYIIFTSGSTGRPKGVLVSHSNFCSSSDAMTKGLGLTTPDWRVLQFSSFTFDPCMLEIFSTLTVGSCVCIPSETDRMNNLAAFMAAKRVNMALLTPSVASLLDPDDVPLLETICFAGEALPVALANKWASKIKAINAYGPTEATIINIWSDPLVACVKDMSLGRPRNCAVWIVDDKFEKLVPINTIGEIVLEGPTIAKGYLGDDTKTAAVFHASPKFLNGVVNSTSRFYRTGDLGRMNLDGTIDYFGRIDAQVKIRGQRVELGEIDHHVKKTLPALEVVTQVLKPKSGGVVLAVFAAKHLGDAEPTDDHLIILDDSTTKDEIMAIASGLSDKLAGILPPYMIPNVIIPCKSIPRTPSGKTDHKKLRTFGNAMTMEQLIARDPKPFRALMPDLSQVERRLRRVWADVLHLTEESIRLDDDFFKLGGDSITAIKVVAACRKAGLRISVATIFRQSILQEMAKVCQSSTAGRKIQHPPFGLLAQDTVENLLAEASEECAVDKRSIEDLYPCSPLQEGLMALNMTRPGAYMCQFVFLLPANIDIHKFKSTFEKIHAESPILRTRFATTQAGSLQAVLKESVHWQHGVALEKFLASDELDYMLPGTRLSRFAIVTANDGVQHFVMTLHHMLYDGWSISLLCNRMNALYSGGSAREPEDFRQFIHYTRALDKEASSAYWAKELSQAPASTFPVVGQLGYQSIARAVVRDQLAIDMDPASGLTMSTMIRAAWAIMISKYSSTQDVVFGAIVSGRTSPLDNVENIDGPVIATVPIRLKPRADLCVIDFLRNVQAHSTAMIQHEHTGIQHIRSINADTRRACDFQNLLVVQFDGEQEAGPLAKPLYREEFTTSPITCEARMKATGIEFATHVDEVVTSRAFAAEAIETLKVILRQLVKLEATSTTKISQIIDQTATEGTLDISEPLPTALAPAVRVALFPTAVNACIHDLISSTAQKLPDSEAIFSTSARISYRDLDELSSRLAGHLVDRRIEPGSIIPLCFEKSIWTVVAMLGVLKAGSAYVALDPSQPIPRLRGTVEAVQAKIVLTSKLHVRTTDLAGPQMVVVDADMLENLPTAKEFGVGKRATPDDLAYLIFTSGSTGTPKGVMISHSAFVTSATATAKAMKIRGQRALQFSSYSFDASMMDILQTLIQGGTVCVPSEKERLEDISGFIQMSRVDYALLTPAVARILSPEAVPLLKSLVIGGDAPDDALVTKWLEAGVQVINAYGPSECSVISTVQVMSPGIDPRTIGSGTGCNTWVVDAGNVDALVSPGEVGELFLGGPTLANGYLNDAEKTAQSFICDPAWANASKSGLRRYYRTGDLVKQNPDGSLVYVGRKDFQVKINGQRIELGEIEAHLNKHKSVKCGIALFPSTGPYDKQLVAVLQLEAPEGGDSDAQLSLIRAELSTQLPLAMVPRHWFSISSLGTASIPLTTARKIDRNRLSALLDDKARTAEHPGNNAEEIIHPDEHLSYALAKKISSMLPGKSLEVNLGYRNIALASSGLDSLNLITLIHYISTKHQAKVTMQLLMDKNTTIRSLANVITSSSAVAVKTVTIDIMAEIRTHDARIQAVQAQSVSDTLVSSVNGGDDCCSPNGLSEGKKAKAGNGQLDRHQQMPRNVKQPCRPTSKLRTVLLTGATGFLGTQILRQLLEQPTIRRVVTVVRGSDQANAEARIIATARKAQWWTELHAEKLEVWTGDLSQPQLGLSSEHWALLAHSPKIDAVIHNGALVHWNMSYAALEAVNVGSTMELLEVCVAAPHQPRFVYVSGGRQWQTEDEEEKDIAEELRSDIGYSQTKFVAEAVTKRAAMRCPQNIAIIKPGLVIGTAHEGVANADDYLWRLAAANIAVGMYNVDEADSWVQLSDATSLAAMVLDAALSAADAAPVRYVRDGLTWGEFWTELRSMGYRLEPRRARQWATAIKADLQTQQETHPLWPLAHMLDLSPADDADQPPLHLRLAVRKNVAFLGDVGLIPRPGETTCAPRRVDEAFTRSRLAA